MITTIQINSAQVEHALAELARRTAHLQPAFDDIGEAIKNNVLFGFRDEKSPDGIKWKALSPQTIARRRNNSSKILNDTGRLKGSFTHVATNSHVEITTDAEYAPFHQFGTSKMVARPFFPSQTLPQEWERDVLDILNLYLQP
jgi:phage virion morphogenesis protein